MKYTAPEVEMLELDLIDVIQTSITDPENPDIEEPGLNGDDLPWG